MASNTNETIMYVLSQLSSALLKLKEVSVL